MYIYKKRKLKNKLKQYAQLLIFIILIINSIILSTSKIYYYAIKTTTKLIIINPNTLTEDTSIINEIIRPLTIKEQIVEAFGTNAEIMLAVCKAESGMNATATSNSDITKDGFPFSIGLYQINLTQHKINSIDCTKAFNGKNYDAVITNRDLYNQCVELASDPSINIATAKKIYDRQGLNAWGCYTNKSYQRFLSSL